ncbi:MAG TPA: 50S ribosomal protein L25 [Terriglobales bacterium]|jgi:large subunit ribosomal protein L25|nr:50S ribosomal protein L25 [Terriglobales bacterium]
MATATTTAVEAVSAEVRDDGSRGKNEARRLRRDGRIPAVLYGAQKPSVAIAVDPKQITRILHSETGHNTIFDLEAGGERTKAMIVDWQYDPVKGALLHVDVKRISFDERIKVKVPILLVGEAPGVKQQSGILEQVLREVEIECLPQDIPSHLDVDVSDLWSGKVIRVADLPHAAKLRFLTDANQTVAHIAHIKEEEVAAPVEVAAEAAVPAEPEVIKKGKQETEEAEGAEGKPEKPEKGEKKEKK